MSRPVDEASALRFAKERVAFYRTTPLDYLGVGVPFRPLIAEDVARVGSGCVALALAEGSVDSELAAKWAEEGDPLFFGALALLVVNHVEGKIRLTEPLLGHALGVLRPPIRLNTQRKDANYVRDLCVTSIVREICERFGLHPTGRSSKRSSACEVVRQALGVSYDSVRKAWDRSRDARR